MKTHDEKVNELAGWLCRGMAIHKVIPELATAILAKSDSMDLADAQIAPDGERTPEATVRRITNLVQLGDIRGAVRALRNDGGLAANKTITDLLEMQKAELARLREDKARLIEVGDEMALGFHDPKKWEDAK